jgi:hypothetical protein
VTALVESEIRGAAGYTKFCFVCGEIATSFTGHIHVDERDYTLGWCEKHSPGGQVRDGFVRLPKTPAEPHCTGCYGRIYSRTSTRTRTRRRSSSQG